MKVQLLFVLLFFISDVGIAAPYFGDSASALAKQSIIHRLQISKISDLDFGEASPGDGPKTIPAGSSETRENASFEIDGEPQRSFQIVLPPRNSIKMLTGGGGANKEITIQEFASTPAHAGVLDQNGKSKVYVGATREAISQNQKTGDYVGQFFVTVVY